MPAKHIRGTHLDLVEYHLADVDGHRQRRLLQRRGEPLQARPDTQRHMRCRNSAGSVAPDDMAHPRAVPTQEASQYYMG